MYPRIYDLRKDSGLSVVQIAEVLEVSQTEYLKYETDENIPTQILIKLSKYYSVTVNYILGLSDEK